MNKHTTTVKIKGKLYDATTGKVVSKPSNSAQHIDGFRAAPKKRRVKTTATNVHTTQQKSKRLHPATARKAREAAAQTTPATTKPVAQKAKQHFTNKARVNRAAQHTRSSLIKKFGGTPAEQPTAPQQIAQEVATPADDPVYQVPNLKALQQIQQPPQQPTVEAQAPQEPSQPNWFVRQFKQRPKMIYISGFSILALLAGGFVTYNNIPNMALRVAASRAGFQASLPNYKPAGYSFTGPVAYSPGSISVNFQSNSDERDFTITQRESSWDSQSLLDNFIISENKQHVTFQERGLTVYVYESSNATWVDGGIWYTIEGNSQLSSEQLLKIAASL